MSASSYDLDTSLMALANKEGASNWTIRDAVEGVQIFGGIGSGKTSGSGRMLALKYLKAGFGGLVLTVKADEKSLWEEYCRLTNRLNDLIVVAPDHTNFFNFLEYESFTDKQRATSTNIVQVLKTVIRASEEKASGKNDDPFWETALDLLIANTIDLCLLAYNKVSVQLLYEIVHAAPRREAEKSEEEMAGFMRALNAARKKVDEQIVVFENNLSDEQKDLISDKDFYEAAVCDAIPNARTLKFVDEFFGETYMNLNEKTRSIIEFSFAGFLFNLLREPIYSLFCRHTSTFTPDDCLKGKIILIDLPVKQYHKAGRDSQILFKYVWQRAMEKRNIKDNDCPVFLWADEAQHFIHEYDAEYQATARSCRIATVYLSQNLPNYHANMGGAKSEFKVKSFLGTLGTKIFHANADIETNRYASELIGDALFIETTESVTASGQFSSTQGKSVKVERTVRAEEFVRLKTGGPMNNMLVEAYIHVQGSTLPSGLNHIKVKFNQNHIP